jgi:UDP-N-acetylglucosamine--N-acetylmuramyl-(pentapeptide) pyrophosphoryl-undecaprenol N-acetylglucosamine transferase
MIVTGNPVRDSLTHGDRQRAITEFGLDPHKKTILILGGSQGASAINQAVLNSLANGSLPSSLQLLWQTGKRDYTEVAAVAGDKVSNRALFPFSEKMPLVYAAADFAIARAGALTLAELSACGLPSLLIPYPIAAGDHQRKNAEECVANGTALMVTEDALDSHDLLKEAAKVIHSEKFMGMRVNIRTANAGKRPALDLIAEDIITLLKEQKGRA